MNPKIGFVFIALITLLLYLTPFLSTLYGTDISKYALYMYFYAMSSYTIIVLGIMFFRFHKMDLFSDQFTLWIIVISCFLRSNFGGKYELFYYSYMYFLGIVLTVYILVNRKSIKTPNLKSIFIGVFWSVCTVFILVLLQIFLEPSHGSLPSDLRTYIINLSVFELSFVTVIEEACFRGLFFGFMVMNGYKENIALFIQAVLFWGGHYISISNPIVFFVFTPLFTLSVTLLIKKYKLLYQPIMVHTMNNVFAGILITFFRILK
jgi:hypothetical protein